MPTTLLDQAAAPGHRTVGIPHQDDARDRVADTTTVGIGLPQVPPLADETDDVLLARLIACDESAWRTVVERYHRLVACSVRRVVSNPADIDEAVQRTWLALWRFSGSVRDARRLPGWLSVTARREALALIRARKHEVLVEDPGRLDTGSLPDASVLVEQAERAKYLRKAVDRLPERQRRLMLELLADRASYDELSTMLDIPRGSIGPMRARALRALREMLHSLEA